MTQSIDLIGQWSHRDVAQQGAPINVLFLRAYVAMVTGRRAVQSCVAEATISVSNTTGKLALLAKARLASVCTADLGYISVNELTSNRPMH